MRRLTEIAQNSQTHTYVGLWHTYQAMSNDQIFIYVCTELIIYLSTYQYFHLYYETPFTIEKVSKGVSLLPYCGVDHIAVTYLLSLLGCISTKKVDKACVMECIEGERLELSDE